MENKNNNTTIVPVLLCELALSGILSLFAFLLFPDLYFLQIIIINIGGFFILYSLLRFIQDRKLNKNLSAIISILNTVAEDLNHDFYLFNKDPKYSELYKQIELFRDKLVKKEENRQQILGLVNSIAVNIEIEKLLDDLMPKLMEVSNSHCCAFYIANNITNRLEIKASLGFNKNLYSEFDLAIGEGIIGSAAKSKETQVITNIPDDTVYTIRSVIGKSKPRSMMVIPVFNREELLGVLALASIYDYTQTQIEMVDLMKYYIGVAISNGLAYEKTKRLTNELKFQNKLIQSLNDELEKSILERTNLMNAVLDSIKHEAIYALDNEYKFLAWNIGAEETLGFKASDVIGKHVDVIFPEEVVKAGSIQDLYEKAARNGRNVVNYWQHKSDGSKIFIEMLVFTRYDAVGKPEGFTTVAKDITYLTNQWIFKVEEDALMAMLRQSNKAILYTDADGLIKHASSAVAELLGDTVTAGCNICDFFEDGYEFKARTDVMRYTSNSEQWRQSLKAPDKNVTINVSVMLSPDTYEKMLLICLSGEENI